MKTLILDNYDSFTYNLYQYVGELGGQPIVKRNDEITLDAIEALRPTHIIISPGPGTPENDADFGVCKDVILNLMGKIPILGVCLGHQGIIHHLGGKIIHAPEVMHGKKSMVQHDGKGIFQGIDSPIEVMRYHSLIGETSSLPESLEISAMTMKDNLIMGVRHKIHPVEGIQFHPESIGTPTGKTLLNNFLTQNG